MSRYAWICKKKTTQNPKSQLILTVFCTLLNTHMHASNMAQINFVKAQDKRVIPSQPSNVGCLELKTRTIMRQTILGKAECFLSHLTASCPIRQDDDLCRSEWQSTKTGCFGLKSELPAGCRHACFIVPFQGPVWLFTLETTLLKDRTFVVLMI